ncbi:MAG: hypothetical protein HYY15_03685 [Candidatus Omnitrophica bacterium]|nr:hypothetical protein [Candidatus Omnitrophota bacterium]
MNRRRPLIILALSAGVWVYASSLRAWSEPLHLLRQSSEPEELQLLRGSQNDNEPSSSTASSQSQSLDSITNQVIAEKAAQRAQDRTQRQRAQMREAATRIAVQVAQEKARQLELAAREAQRQLALARERQLKFLYSQALSLYRRGAYQDAIEQLQQMALLDPAHPLVKAAQHLMTQAEAKRLEQRGRAHAALPPQRKAAPAVSDLERLLTEKRIEQDTLMKYAKTAMKEQRHDMAMELAYRVLHGDPENRAAQQLVHEAQLAKLKDDDQTLKRSVELDEAEMMNDVLERELLTPPAASPRGIVPAAHVTSAAAELSGRFTQPISCEFQDVPLGDVLDFLGDAANVSLIPSPRLDLKGTLVSLKADRLPFELALKYLAKSEGLAYRQEDSVILISTEEELANEPLETRVFFLRAGLGPFALETAAVDSSAPLKMESIKGLIEQTITQPSGGKLVIDERSGSVIITNTAENLRKVERLLSRIDTTPIQVLIESRFIELTLTDLQQMGFESVLTGDYPLSKAKTNTQGVEGLANEQIIGKGGGFKFPALARESESLNITLQGVLTGFQFESVLHLLEENQKSKTLSAPRVTTLNHQPASIKVVDEFRYPTRYELSLVQFDANGDGDFDDAGEAEFVNVPQDFQKRDVGILLNVTPSVGDDLKTVTLVLAPEVSSFSQFRDLGGGVTVPEFTSSQLTTSVVIQDGETVVLGGLIKDSRSEQLTKVPLLGDLPLVGGLFRQTEESQTRKNLLIFVTARILAPRGPTI